jgi:hypothetical protein
VVAGILAFALTPSAAADIAGPASRPLWRVFTMGDSLAAGEGAPDVNGVYGSEGSVTSSTIFEDWDTRFGGSPATPGSNQDSSRCHRSGHTSPSAVATIALQSEFPDVQEFWRSAACSGAAIVYGGSLSGDSDHLFDNPTAHKGGILLPYNGVENLGKRGISSDHLSPTVYPTQIEQVNTFLHELTLPNRKVDAMVISGGANDMGFGPLVQECANIGPNLGTDCDNEQKVKDFIDLRLKILDKGVAGQIHSSYERLAESLQGASKDGDVVLDAAPAHVYIQAIMNVARSGTGAGLASFCNQQPNEDYEKNVKDSESQFLSNEVVDRLNAVIAAKATLHNWTFVNRYVKEFIGHGFCASASNRWVNTNHDSLAIQGQLDETRGVPFVSVGGGIGHPNATGYQMMGNAVHDSMLPDFLSRFSAHAAPITQVVSSATGFQVTIDDSQLPALSSGYWHRLLLRQLNADGTHSNVGGTDGSVNLGYGTTSRSYPRTGRYFLIARACGPLSRNGAAGCGPTTGEIPVSTFVPQTPVALGAVRGVPSNFAVFTKHGITVQWSHADDNARFDTTSSVVRVRQRGSRFLLLRTIPGQTTRTFFTDADLDPAGTYEIEVKACNDGNRCSAFTSAVQSEPGPTGLKFFDLSGIEISAGAACSHVSVPFDSAPLPSPAPGAGDAFPTFLTTCPTDLPVGRLYLARRSIKARAGKLARLDLVWTAPRRWRDLQEVIVQFVDSRDHALATLRFSDQTGTLTLARGAGRRGPHLAVGKSGTLRAGGVRIRVAKDAVHGSGPTGRTVRLRVGVIAGRGRFGVSVGATDDVGRSQPPTPAGEISVRR